MCEPATISAIVGYVAANATAISAATAVVSTAAAAYGQNQTYKANANNARNAQDLANAGLEAQQHQVDAQASDQMSERAKQAMAEMGSLNAIFADTGLTGNSHARLAANASANAGADITAIERNRTAALSQGSLQRAGADSTAQGRINSVARPSLIGTGLQIVSAGADAYSRRNPRGA
jgi:hypothetical protein